MKAISDIETRAKEVIVQLRIETLKNNEPFMVFDESLPEGCYYMEYPEGDISIVTASRDKSDFIVQKELTASEIHQLRTRLLLKAVF